MEKITSFTIDHIKLQPGLYVSRKDKGANHMTANDVPALLDEDLPQQAIVSAFRKYSK